MGIAGYRLSFEEQLVSTKPHFHSNINKRLSKSHMIYFCRDSNQNEVDLVIDNFISIDVMQVSRKCLLRSINLFIL